MSERDILQNLSHNPAMYLLGYLVVEIVKTFTFSQRRRKDEEERQEMKCRMSQDTSENANLMNEIRNIHRKLDDLRRKH